MFFYVAKIFWFFIQPLNLSIVLLSVGAIFLFARKRVLASLCGGGALFILFVSAWTSLGAFLLGPLEARFPRPPAPDRVDGIIVLGGGLEGRINLARGGYELNSGGDRFLETAALAHRFPEAKIVVSGGSGAILRGSEADADTATRLFTALGIEEDRLILEDRSRDTYENAMFTKELVDPQPDETWLLVTSAFHMPRSAALFAKAGLVVLPWPSDFRTTGDEGWSLFADNAADALQSTTTGIREWLGLIAYWLSGRIDSPFPVPQAAAQLNAEHARSMPDGAAASAPH